MKHGFIKVAAATPTLRVADPTYNVAEMIQLAKDASANAVDVLVFPELCISGYTCGDLFFSSTLISACRQALTEYVNATAKLPLFSVVGIPLEQNGRLYDCAVAICGGNVLGAVPKKNPTVGAPYGEIRHFSPAPTQNSCVCLQDNRVISFGTDLTFTCREMPLLQIARGSLK